MRKKRTGQILLTVVAAVTGVSPFLADWNETHIHNEKWPPHAKFHNGQTMSMAALLAASSLAAIWRRRQAGGGAVLAAVGFTSLYWVSQAMAFAFPGVAWTDPHLLRPGQSLDQFPQQVPLEIALLGLVGAGAALMTTGIRDEARSQQR